MKRFTLIAVVLSILVASAAYAGSAPQRGTFEGNGTWTSADGQKGEYRSEVTISADAITISFETNDERSYKGSHSMGLKKQSGSQYDLLDGQGVSIGTLSCRGNECKYTVSEGGAEVTSTMRFVGNTLHHSGTKSFGQYQIEWSEVLNLR